MQAHGVQSVYAWLHLAEDVDHRRVLDLVEVVWLVQAHYIASHQGRVADADHEVGSSALDRVVQHIDECLELAGEGLGKVQEEAAPDLALLKGPEVVASNDSEVVSGTLEGSPQIRVVVGIRLHDLTRGENDLVIDNIVADETLRTG